MSASFSEEFHLSSLTLNAQDQSCFYRSQWRLPKWAYPFWRLFWCVWHMAWLIASGVRTRDTAPEDEDGVKWFVYASNWTFLLTTVFCVVDFLLVISATCRRSHEGNQIDQPEVTPSSRETQEILFHGEFTLIEGIKMPTTPCPIKLQWFLFEAINCANLLTTIVYWAAQHQEGDHIYADIVVFNIINSVFVIANTFVTGIPVRMLHFIYPAAFISVYFLFNLIYYLADGTGINGSDVIYRPLEWDKSYPTAFTIIVGLVLATPVAHLVFFSIFTLRIYIADTFGLGKKESEPVMSSHYRKRTSDVKIEEGGEGQKQVRNYAHDNAGFEPENRR